MKKLICFLLFIVAVVASPDEFEAFYPNETIVHNLSVNIGWNFVSVPIDPVNGSVLDTLGGCIPTLGIRPPIYWSGTSFQEALQIKPKLGYWIFSPFNTVCPINGSLIRNPALKLSTGWNMIGVATTHSKQDLNLIPNQVGIRKPIKWTGTRFEEIDEAQPGDAIWIFVTRPTNVWRLYNQSMINLSICVNVTNTTCDKSENRSHRDIYLYWEVENGVGCCNTFGCSYGLFQAACIDDGFKLYGVKFDNLSWTRTAMNTSIYTYECELRRPWNWYHWRNAPLGVHNFTIYQRDCSTLIDYATIQYNLSTTDNITYNLKQTILEE